MLPRFHLADISTVLHFLGVLVLITGALMFVPLLVALIAGETAQAVAFVFGIGVSLFSGALLYLFRARKLDRRRSLLLVGMGWVVAGLIASVPMYISGDFDNYVAALFDAVSALTTTGASLATDVDHVGYAQTTWRAVLTLVGGQAVILVAMHLGFFGEGGNITVANKTGVHDERTYRLKDTVKFIVLVGAFFLVTGTVGVCIICLTLGMSLPDSVMTGFWLITNALSTSGFTPHSSSLVYYHSAALDAFLLIFMLAGALNFAIFGYALRGKLRPMFRNSETRTFAIWLLLLVAFVSFALSRDQVFSSATGLFVNGTFMTISAATTSGMCTIYPQQFGITISESVIIILEVAMLVGACSHSTGGGIKVLRIMQVLRWIVYSIRVRLMPRNAHVRVNYQHFGLKHLTARDATFAMTISILYIATAALGSMLFIAHGGDAIKSVYEAASLVSNTGLTAGMLSSTSPIDLTLVGILLMWAGRLEFIALIAAFVGLIISLEPSNILRGLGNDGLGKKKLRSRGGKAWRRWRNQKRRRSKAGNAERATRCVGAVAAIVLSAALVGAPASYAVDGGVQIPSQGDASIGAPASDAPEPSGSDTYRSVAISDLLSATERLNGRSVKFSGEAIGEPIVADDGHKWVNVMAADKSMIGVYMTNEQATVIEHYGAYRMTGDTVLVEGSYQIACPDHNDEIGVHADAVTVSAEGASYERSWSMTLFTWGVVLGGVGSVLFAITMLRRGRLRRRPRA